MDMIYRIFGGLGLTLLGLSYFSTEVPHVLIGIFLLVGGVALLANL